jgi:hypothetical protein
VLGTLFSSMSAGRPESGAGFGVTIGWVNEVRRQVSDGVRWL